MGVNLNEQFNVGKALSCNRIPDKLQLMSKLLVSDTSLEPHHSKTYTRVLHVYCITLYFREHLIFTVICKSARFAEIKCTDRKIQYSWYK